MARRDVRPPGGRTFLRDVRRPSVGAWREDMYAAQEVARVVVALFEPQAPDSFAAWGLFNACFEQKEHMEPYVAEQIAREMMAQNPQLGEEFNKSLAQDAAFAADP